MDEMKNIPEIPENPIDVTSEADVSEEVTQYTDENPGINPLPMFETVPEGSTVLISMDSHRYLLDFEHSDINWEETSSPENMKNIRSNEEFILAVLRELFFSTQPTELIEQINTFVEGFGLTPNYSTDVYPYMTEWHKHVMTCIDALQIIHAVQAKCAAYIAAHPTTSNEEETPNED